MSRQSFRALITRSTMHQQHFRSI